MSPVRGRGPEISFVSIVAMGIIISTNQVLTRTKGFASYL